MMVWIKKSGRVGKISNMFDILTTHSEKPGKYNQPLPTMETLLLTLEKSLVTDKMALAEYPHNILQGLPAEKSDMSNLYPFHTTVGIPCGSACLVKHPCPSTTL